MPFQRRNQGLAALSPPIPQRPSRNRLLTTRVIENDPSQPRRRQQKNDLIIEVTIIERKIKESTDINIDTDLEAVFVSFFNVFSVRSRHNIGRTIFIYKRNDDER